jgi:hypothetical protein
MKKKTRTDFWQHPIATQGKYLYVFSEQMLSCNCRSTQICIRRKHTWSLTNTAGTPPDWGEDSHTLEDRGVRARSPISDNSGNRESGKRGRPQLRWRGRPGLVGLPILVVCSNNYSDRRMTNIRKISILPFHNTNGKICCPIPFKTQ